jgi:hypothetical protein
MEVVAVTTQPSTVGVWVRRLSETRFGAWFLWVFASGLTISWISLSILAPSDIWIVGISAVGFLLLGCLIVTNIPSNRIGWVMVVAGGAWLAYESGAAYAGLSLSQGPFPLEHFAAWLGVWTGPLFFLGFPIILLVFPDGRLLEWRRWLLPILALPLVAVVAAAVALWDLPANVLLEARETGGGLAESAVLNWSFPVSAFLAVPATLSPLLRYRSGTPVERQQIKWLLVGAVANAIGLVAALVMDTVTESLTLFLIVMPVTTLFPITIGIAVFRYRLYEVDRFISRTVAYALVVGFLAGVFVAGVVWIPNAVGLDDSPLVVAASTLAVAAVFNPLRRRTQIWVDRRFNRSHYDAARVLESFAASLQARVDPDGVMHDLVEVVREAMQPSAVGAWMRDRT